MNKQSSLSTTLPRRAFLQNLTCGLGGIALSSLLHDQTGASENAPPLPRPHFAPRARSVIFLHMVGAPSQLDLFDHKPLLNRLDGEPVPRELIEGQRFAFLRGHPKLMGTKFHFSRHGQSGLELSELLPHLSMMADNLCLIKTVHTEEFNHAPAQLFLQTGFGQFGRPSIGSWVTYGLGTENADLPAFVVLVTGLTAGAGNSLWGSGFLPTVHQGIQFRSSGDPVLFLSNPRGVNREDRRNILDGIQELNRLQFAQVGDPEIATRIAQYELAYRMQMSVPDLTDLSREPRYIHQRYGTRPGQVSFANNCLLARRLVERGVRFVQLYDSGWDHHGNLISALRTKCRQVDQPVAALLRDLQERGLLDQTLVVWASEFGRTPMLQGNPGPGAGRDHHKEGYCAWMAGGGIRGGMSHGQTDDFGYFPVQNPVHLRDLHATLLHTLGLDHERLTFRFQGRRYRLTDVGGRVVENILA